jgi:hypothetical protein
MPRKGHKYTPAQRENCRKGHLGQRAWNKGTGGCRRGHDLDLWVTSPGGIPLCLGCKRENGARYRAKNREHIRFQNRIDRYDLSEATFMALWAAQHGECAICHASFESTVSRIDHDHVTGAVRGILCVPCNTGIGCLRDSVPLLHEAVRYLTDPPARALPSEDIASIESSLVPQLALFPKES